jgi:hypothetical protein
MSQFSRKPRTASAALVLDGELLGEIDQLTQTLRTARMAEKVNPSGLNGQVPKLEAELNALTLRASEEAVVFTVKALPGDAFDEIKRNHQPSPEMMEAYREQSKVTPFISMPEMDPTSMGPDLLAACLVAPEMSEAEVRELWSELSKGEQNQLWNLALGVQVEGASLPLSRAAIGTTGNGGEPSTTPASEESPSQSSSDG